MEKIIEELHSLFTFKTTTEPGDIVIIYVEKTKSLLYGLILDFERDTNKRDEWWHVKMQFLTVPPQKVTWTLRTPQFTGQEVFTIGGEKHFIKAVNFKEADSEPQPPKKDDGKSKKVSSRPSLRIVK